MFIFQSRCCVTGAKILTKTLVWYSFYTRVEYQRLHENNLARRRQLMCYIVPTYGSLDRTYDLVVPACGLGVVVVTG
jgi:hypothetical protein